MSAGGAATAAWVEFRNKLAVWRWVDRVGPRVWAERPSLAEALAVARGMGPFAEPWVVEGIGRGYAEDAWRAGGSLPDGLLRGAAAADLPLSSLLMLNAGLGLAFADRLLGELGPAATPADHERAMATLRDLCHANSSPGYEASALQGLGLVARIWHAPSLASIAAAVAAVDPDLPLYFWHAVGRAFYFLPRYFLPLPGTARRALALLHRECPDPRSTRQAVAGFACAVALVNMQHPALVERLLAAVAAGGGELAAVGAGVRCACAVRAAVSPERPFVDRLLRYDPRSAAAATAWEARVLRPCARGLEDLPGLEREGRLAELLAGSGVAVAGGPRGAATRGVEVGAC